MSEVANELCFMSARDMVDALHRRRFSCRELLSAHLEQIDRVNPAVNAIVTFVPEQAMDAAGKADQRLIAGEDVGALHGLPIAHKDTHTTRGIRTTHGSSLLADNVPEENELIIERLQAAGAISIGKTNVPEFAAGSHTFNSVFGVTRNPYALDRSAGGSSGGAAAALACGMQPLADGSDMGGSLRNPASFCNVVGFRPSPGLVPTFPAPMPWSTLSVQGPMARSVGDVAFMLASIAGPDPRAPLSLNENVEPLRSLEPSAVRGLRLAWSPDLGGAVPVDATVKDTLEGTLHVFEELGCTVELDSPDFSGADDAFRILRAWHFEANFGKALRDHPEAFKKSLAQNIEAGTSLSGRDVSRAFELQADLFHRFRRFFEEYDALLLPVSQVAPFPVDIEFPVVIDGVEQESYLDWMRSAYYISVATSPALSVPAGFTDSGLPVGLQIVGPYRADRAVLQIGAAFEAATDYGAQRPDVVGMTANTDG